MSENLTVGQEVRVFDVNGSRMGQPEGGWIGEIVKVGRTLVHPVPCRGYQKLWTVSEAAEDAVRVQVKEMARSEG